MALWFLRIHLRKTFYPIKLNVTCLNLWVFTGHVSSMFLTASSQLVVSAEGVHQPVVLRGPDSPDLPLGVLLQHHCSHHWKVSQLPYVDKSLNQAFPNFFATLSPEQWNILCLLERKACFFKTSLFRESPPNWYFFKNYDRMLVERTNANINGKQ